MKRILIILLIVPILGFSQSYFVKTINSTSADSSGNVTVSTGSGTVTSVATDNTLTGGTITTSGTLKVDTSRISTKGNVTGLLTAKLGFSDTTSTISTKANVTGVLLGYTTNTKLTDSLSTKTNKLITTVRYTQSDTLILSDADKLLEMNSASANNLSVPANASVPFSIGTQILIAQYGAGQTTLVALSGVTIRSASGKLKLTGQYSGATLVKIATNEWYLFGDITN